MNEFNASTPRGAAYDAIRELQRARSSVRVSRKGEKDRFLTSTNSNRAARFITIGGKRWTVKGLSTQPATPSTHSHGQ